MNRRAIRSIFSRFFGSGVWAARILNVKPPTVSAWLRNKKTSAKLAAQMPELAQRLKDTKGACIHDVPGWSPSESRARWRH